MQSIKRTWLKYIYLVWSLSYQQWSNSLCDVRFVLTNGYMRPGAMGSDNACQIEVAIALSHGVLHSLAQRSPWDLERGSVFFQLGFPPADFCLPFFPLFSIFIYSPPSFSFIFLSFVPSHPFFPLFLWVLFMWFRLHFLQGFQIGGDHSPPWEASTFHVS